MNNQKTIESKLAENNGYAQTKAYNLIHKKAVLEVINYLVPLRLAPESMYIYEGFLTYKTDVKVYIHQEDLFAVVKRLGMYSRIISPAKKHFEYQYDGYRVRYIAGQIIITDYNNHIDELTQ